jgi:hypothetical protein
MVQIIDFREVTFYISGGCFPEPWPSATARGVVATPLAIAAHSCRRVVRRESGCTVITHSCRTVVASTILRVRDPNVGFGEGGIEVRSFTPGFSAGNHSIDTQSAVTSEPAKLLVQSSKRSERSTMNDEADRRIVVPATDDPCGHHDMRFAWEPWL